MVSVHFSEPLLQLINFEYSANAQYARLVGDRVAPLNDLTVSVLGS
jgi:hypothetical protein